MKKIDLKLRISIGQIISALVLLFFIGSFLFLFRNEYKVGNNNGNIKIVASNKRKKQSIATDEKIQDVIVNGLKRTQFSKNTWITEDNSHLVEQTYYASGNNKVIEFQAKYPVISLSFTSHKMPSGGILQVYLDDKLYTEINSFSFEQTQESHVYIFPGSFMISKENFIWYLILLASLLASFFFVQKKIYLKIPIRDWILLLALSSLSLFSIDWALSHRKVEYFQFWNSDFEKSVVYLLVPTLLTHLFVVFQLLYYWSKRYRLATVLNRVALGLTYVMVPFLTYYIIENGYSSYQNIELHYAVYNLMAYTLIFICFSWVLASFKRAGALLFATALVFGFITNILIDTRSEPLLPYHFYQLTTGLNVAAKTNFEFTDRILQSFLLTSIFMGVLLLNPENLNFVSKTLQRRQVPKKWILSIKLLSSTVATVFTICVLPTALLAYASQAQFSLNTQRMQSTYAKKGFFLAFSHYYMSSKLEEPSEYGESKMKEIYSPFEPKKVKTDKLPNIIIIQNESQADYGALTNLEFSVDPMEFQHSLKENTISGETYVSVFGGGTSNTEYEMLTSNALAGLPLNIFPFQQLVNKKSDSLVWTLSQYGYDTVAMHPETKNNYRRERVYQYLGFDSYYFTDTKPSIDDLFGVEYERNFVSDRSLYKGIQQLLTEKKGKEPLFNFVVTMQGHGSYNSSLSAYERTVSITNVESQNDSATEYLTSLRSSDQALKELVTFLKKFEEPTVLIMYGDHHPTLSSEFFGTYMDSSQPGVMYKTPFLIWSNFDIPERENVSLSVNYLAPYLLNILSETNYALPVSSYYQYMYQLYQEVPIQTTWGYYSADGQFMESPEDIALFEDYKYVLYNHVKDSQDYKKYYE